MRVVIDCRWIRSVKLDGIGRYTFELVRELIALPERDTIYILLVHDREVAAWLEKECQLDTFTHVRLHRLKYPILSFSDVRHLRGDLEALQPDIVFCPNYLSWPFSSRFRTIMVVHDLIPFIMPEVCTTPKWKLFYGTPWFARSILNRADTIVTVSAHTAHDIQARFHIPEDQIRVIPEGVADRFSLPVDEARKNLIRERYHLPEKYILCVSRQQPYKNLLGLIRAYMQLPDELKVRYMLVLTGESHRLYSGRLSEAIDPLVLSYLAVFTGFVGDDDLPGLYQMASLFVLPSLYEGFGLPVLEAMAAGCPVACSRTASLPDVGGEAAAYFDPQNSSSITDTMSSLLFNERELESMRVRGAKQAAKYTWSATAQQVHAIFHS